jgi:hypothetical protein
MPANDTRSLDRILRTLRATMRTRGLPRPDRLVISTRSRSAHAEFSTGTAPDRLAGLLLWTATLHGVSLVWTYRPGDHTVTVAATGRTGSGIAIGLACSAAISDLGGHVHDGVAVLARSFRLVPFTPDPVSFDELAQVVAVACAAAPARLAEVAA